MKRIDSAQNEKIKAVRQIAERKTPDLWILEGIKLISEAFDAPVQMEEIYLTPALAEKEALLMGRIEAKRIPVFQISQNLMERISNVDTPQGILAVVRKTANAPQAVEAKFGALLLSIRDPGNFGAILRVAEAAGCGYVAYTSDCVDPYLPKTVRASTGSILRLPLLEVPDVKQFLTEKELEGVCMYALDAHRGMNLFQQMPKLPALILVGSESQGLPPNIAVKERIRIPMEGKIESLNAAVAVGICFYWFANSSSLKHGTTESTEEQK
jgi:RNA methyltransferase, TrmH family